MADIISPERHAHGGGPGLSYLVGTKILGAPLFMLPTYAQQIKSAVESKAFDTGVSVAVSPQGSKFVGTYDARSRFRVTEDGIACVSVQGMLFDRGSWLGDLMGFATSYEGLAEQFRRLAKDSAVKSVILDIDSPGGMVAGIFDLCQELGKLKRAKKVYGIAANMADSAAYAIGCACHELYVTRTGEAGSIGVIAFHQSYQRALDAAGIDSTIIHAGDHKADGNPFQQLSHGARAEMMSDVDAAYAAFVAHVAKQRGIGEDEVRATQARVFRGADAVKAKLADGVKSFEELLDHVRSGAGSRGKPPKNGGRTVSDNETPVASRPDYDMIISAVVAGMTAGRAPAAPVQAAVPAAPAAPAPVAPAAPAAAAPVAQTDAKERIRKILGCEAAKTRPGLASYLALEKDYSAEDSIELLGKAPAETGEAAASGGLTSALHAQMQRPGNSAAVKPEAAGGGGRPSLAEKVKARAEARRSN